MSTDIQSDPNQNQTKNDPLKTDKKPYLTSSDKERFERYRYYRMLFEGDHFEAFKLKIRDIDFSLAYSKIRYIAVNFAGLVSKISADMLFSEPITIKVPGGDQAFVDALLDQNKFFIQLYESALQNSYFGDELFKVRTDVFSGGNDTERIFIEEQTPLVYFPEINPFNIREDPKKHVFAYKFRKNDVDYLRKEIHEIGKITNEVYRLDGDIPTEKVSLDILGEPNIEETVDTGVSVPLVFHVPNWKTGSRWNGFSDYHDLTSLFFAINNRISKVDNVLDLHTDPILLVPPGILDEKGKPKKSFNKMIERSENTEGKPEYIVWDASLENAFKQIEKLVEFMYLIAEVSPDLLGMGNGVSDSGRALKFKVLRTIAKVARKKLYYDRMIKDVIYSAQTVAYEKNIAVGGITMKQKPVKPEILWQDGLPIDDSELIDTETKALDAGITTTEDSIMRVYKVDEASAKNMVKIIKDEKSLNVPPMGSFGQGNNNTNQ